MSTIYHLLSEAEAFSEHGSGAISRWAANVLRAGTEVVVCPSADSSWGFPAERVYCMPNWKHAHPVHPILYRLPWLMQKPIYTRLFQGLLRRAKRGDIIYVHNAPESASVLASATEEQGVKVILHMHNSHLVRANRGQLAALRNVPLVCVSNFILKEVQQALPGHFQNTHVVYNGADDRLFTAVDRAGRSVPTVIFTGRLVSYKGVHILLQAMRILERRGVKAQCKIVGRTYFANNKSTRYSRYLEQIRPDNTELVGYRSGKALAELLQEADIYCCPSIWNDPFPLAPIEAMATGLPVVASRTGGIPEMLAYGGGVMVPPENPEALAEQLERVIGDGRYRKELSTDARSAFQKHFLWSSVRRQYEDVVRSVAA